LAGAHEVVVQSFGTRRSESFALIYFKDEFLKFTLNVEKDRVVPPVVPTLI